MFMSNLSVSEFALAVMDGWTPLGIVSGTFVCSVETEPEMPTASRELTSLTRRYQKACCTVLERLQESAAKRGATGVVGVRLHSQVLEKDVVEWTVYGTAVASSERPQGPPFVSALSGQDCSALARAGILPVGVAYGVCVYYQQPHVKVQRKLRTGIIGTRIAQPNVERSDYTRGVYKARQNAMTRLRDQATRFQADGVLGVQVKLAVIPHHTSSGFAVHLTALGTAVVMGESVAPTVNYQLPLLDR